ncbi:MAG: calcium/sodium antiporter [Vicingaceae bacterium]
MDYIQLIAGLIILVIGGESLVKGAVSIALRAKISSLVIGMTVVSFGTSAPELLVSLQAALTGHPDVSVGAVVGSNISNLGLVLGITVLIFPILVHRDSLRIDWPIMMLSTLLFFGFALDGKIDFYEGLVFVIILVAFTSWLIVRSRIQGKALVVEKEITNEGKSNSTFKDVTLLIVGISGLYFGAEWLIDSVVNIAESHNISEKLISVTVVAFGTSLPELVTSVMASIRKESDLSVGNLIGSNLFNIFAILGITAIVEPISVTDSINNFDVYFLLLISFIILPFMLFGKYFGRAKGIFLVLFYAVYVYFSIASEI